MPSPKLDSFTAATLLSTMKDSPQETVDLWKCLFTSEEGPITPEQEAYIKPRLGMPCRIGTTNMVGVVERINKSTGGWYPGSRYPVYVRIVSDDRDEHNATGQIYEYYLHQLEFICDDIDHAEQKGEFVHLVGPWRMSQFKDLVARYNLPLDSDILSVEALESEDSDLLDLAMIVLDIEEQMVEARELITAAEPAIKNYHSKVKLKDKMTHLVAQLSY